MKKIRIRHTGGTNLNELFSGRIMGGERGFGDSLAMETFSNDLAPTIKCMQGFTVIVEVYEEKDN